ncbi:hypothetical protein DRN75_03860 [Nanoarchaeota archaeon]|nr:MAG: hypothetical protein DRN75_03860 [Nanoarchaeota archaeon]
MITKKVWESWREGRAKYYYIKPSLQQLMKLGEAPEVFIKREELRVLEALNSGVKERTLIQLRYLTRFSYPFIIKTIRKFEKEGLVITYKTKITRKGKEVATNKRFVRITEKGLELLKQWREIYSKI